MNRLIEISNLQKNYNTIYGEIEAIKDFSQNINEGDFIVIVGSSGCGKSTLLSLICGLEEKSNGNIKFNKENFTIGYMFQQDLLFPWLTVYDNTLIGLKVKSRINEESKKYIDKLLKDYNLLEFKEKYPESLSGGMKQRVALIRTLAINPDLLLLDEPFSALDYQTRIKISDDLYKIIKKEKKTVIMVTHDLSEAITLADKIIILSKRPSKIKNIYTPIFDNQIAPSEKRNTEEFYKLYNLIWRDLDK